MTLTETFAGVEMDTIKKLTGCNFHVESNLKINNY